MQFWQRKIDSVHAFYLNGLLRSLFMAMTTIYVPIFLFLQGLERWGSIKTGLLLIVAYYCVQRGLILVALFPLSRIIERIGFRKSITISVFLLMAYTVSLFLATKDMSWIWVACVLMGLNAPMYWVARDSALSQDIENKKMGSKMGYLVSLENIAGLFGPFAGGAIVAFFGYPTLFVVALVVLGMSAVPLWWMPPHTHKNGVSLKGFWYFVSNKRYLHQSVGAFATALSDYGNAVIWPLALFLQGIRDEKMGAVYSLAGGVTIVVQYLSGRWFDKLRSRKDYTDEGIYGLATVGLAMSWILRLFVKGFTQVASLDVGRQIFGALHANFFSDYIHLGGKRMGSIAFWVYVEMVYSVGAIFIFVVMLVGIYFDVWKELVFATIALWSLATIAIARESNLK